MNKKKRRINLKTPGDARRFLTRIINELNNDDISTDKARAFGMLINAFNRSFELYEIDRKLDEMKKGNVKTGTEEIWGIFDNREDLSKQTGLGMAYIEN